jgi:hypothetical protein
MIYADPGVNNGDTVLEDDFEAPPDPDPAGRPNPGGHMGLWHVPDQMIDGQTFFVALLGSPRDASNNILPGGVKVGDIYDANKRGRYPAIGPNSYEACMKFTDPAGKTAYYPGGVASGGLTTKEQVIQVFTALALLSNPPGGLPNENLVKVEKVVKAYR